MRLTRIRCKNFLCHVDVDLALGDLSLFAITGPTGAGKTALTDAITLALFGYLPRAGKQHVREFIRHGARDAEVAVEFSLPRGLFRATRKIKRARSAASATLVALDPLTRERTRVIATGPAEVAAAATELLGMGYDTFVTSVLLPQGRFAQFLTCPPAERQDRLRELLGLQHLDRLQQLAAERERDQLGEMRRLQGDLDSDAWSDAGPDRLATARAAFDAATATLAQLRAGLADLAAQVADDDRRLALVAALADTERVLAVLREREPGIALLARKLDAAQRAATVRAPLEHHAAATTAARDATARLAAARTAHATAASQLDARRAALQRREPTLTDTLATTATALAQLDALEPLAARLRALTTNRAALASKLAAATTAHREQLQAVDALREQTATATAERERLEVARRETPEPPPDGSFVAAAAAHAQWLAADRAATTARESFATTTAQLAAARDELAALDASLAIATTASATAAAALDAAQRERDSALREQAARSLREHLHAGDACPVCKQTVTAIASLPDAPDLQGVESALLTARRSRDRADAGLREATAARAMARAQHDQLAAARERAEPELAVAEAAERDAAAAALLALREAGVGAPHPREAARQAITAARRRATTARDTLAQISAGLDRVAQTLAAAATLPAEERLAAQLASARDERASALCECDDEAAALCQQLQAATGASDLDARRRELIATRDAATDELALLKDAVAMTQRDLDVATAALQAREQVAREASDALQRAAAGLAVALTAAGFDNADAARAAQADAGETRMWQRDVDDHRRQLDTASAERERVAASIGDNPPDATAAAQRRATLQQRQHQRDELLERRAALQHELDRMRRLEDERRALQAGFDAARQRHDALRAVADDLRADRLPQWIVGQALDDLARRASLSLRELTDRYDIAVGDGGGEFIVIDNDNAGERRSVRTLSGGELFLVSLALALALGESRRAHSLNATSAGSGCLILDEGFGALDAASLDLAVSALESLHARGCQIGVISHVDALSQRLPGRVQVDRDGSVRVVHSPVGMPA